MTVWSPVANTTSTFKVRETEQVQMQKVAATTTTTGAWETISFDFSAEGELTFESVTLFMNFQPDRSSNSSLLLG